MSEPSGRRILARSFADALRGVWDGVKTERNMRVHLIAGAYVLFFASRLELTRGEWACLFLAIGGVTAAELLNTAVEKLCDFSEKHLNPHIRVVKDMAAGAVFLCAVFAALTGAAVFLRPALWDTVVAMVSAPVSLCGLILSACAAVVFIRLGPVGIRRALGRLRKR